jgi:hypothetical protein
METREVVINPENKCFIISKKLKNGKGFTTPLPFDYAYKIAKMAYDWLSTLGVDLSEIKSTDESLECGTQRAWKQYCQLSEMASEYQIKKKVQCEVELNPKPEKKEKVEKKAKK